MLPQDGHEDEDGGDEDESEGDLGNWSRGEGLDIAFRAFGVFLLVPAGEGSEEKEADKGEDNSNDTKDC